MIRKLIILVGLMLLPNLTIAAQEVTQDQIRFFESEIRPALVKYCYECHSVAAGDSRAGLLVDSRQGLLQGGDSGPAIVPGHAEESLLLDAINWEGYEMPPSEKMPASVIAKFEQWIQMDAPDPREREQLAFKTKISAEEIEAGKQHWSLKQPESSQAATIDKLVNKQLDEAGLTPVGIADAFTLLRRLNFDLIGLPATPSELQSFKTAFERHPSRAVSEKIDELLSRPQFGERWGRHWLDVARYAESSGSRNVSYPHAWRYRDYVIDAFNDDTPYDQFIIEQVAGDLLPAKSELERQENLLATGFLAIGMKHHDERNPRKFTADMVDEQIDTITQSVLGLTVACARCHDHKYDPIPTDDYYAIAGILYSTETFYGTTRIGQNHRPSDLLRLPLEDDTSPVSARSQQSIAAIRKQIDELDREARGLRGQERRQIRNMRNRLASQLDGLNPDGTQKAFGMGVQEANQVQDARILLNGEIDHPAQPVSRGFLQVLGNLNFTVDSDSSSGRLQLAHALTSEENPLTARVMANRVWMHLIGKPLVGTPSNFGASGMQPTNQELLDYLAIKLMDENWSIKALIREIAMSDTYRRSSTHNARNYELDPENETMWRANARQLDAEAMRDAMLALSGRLTLERPYASPVSNGGGRPGAMDLDETTYRSVYLPIVRDSLPTSLELFDFPDPNSTNANRSESIVSTQALYMMNGEFVRIQASAMASSLERYSANRGKQVQAAFLWAYGRPPTSAELAASNQFFDEFDPQTVQRRADRPTTGRPQLRNQRDWRDNNDSSQLRRRPRSSGQNMGGPQTRRRGPNGGGRREMPAADSTASDRRGASPEVTDPALTVFCQTLLASASFRILN